MRGGHGFAGGGAHALNESRGDGPGSREDFREVREKDRQNETEDQPENTAHTAPMCAGAGANTD